MVNFQLDTLAIISYADDGYGDSVLAHGTVTKLAVASPLPLTRSAICRRTNSIHQRHKLAYTLEQSDDFKTWTPAAPVSLGNGTNLILVFKRPTLRLIKHFIAFTLNYPDRWIYPIKINVRYAGARGECQLCSAAAYKGPCWCAQTQIPEALLLRKCGRN